MALFSDVDWVIIAVVAAFLFLGPQGRPFIRQMGRWYARLLQFKTELMSEVTAAATGSGAPIANPSSLRSAFFGWESTTGPSPARVMRTTEPGILTQNQPVTLWAVETQTLGAGIGAGSWWIVSTNAPGEVVRLR